MNFEQTLNARLAELKAEYQKGRERLEILDQELASLKASMLRISGAIQVLEELLENPDSDSGERGDKMLEEGEIKGN